MTEAKTRPTGENVTSYLRKIDNKQRRDDCAELVKLFTTVVKAQPVMWGSDIVGFGSYTMTYADGRELDWPLTGFSPRKAAIVLYIPGLRNHGPAIRMLGKCKASGGCLHVKALADVDLKGLKTLVATAVKEKRAKTSRRERS
jgi:hypothetical protein